MHPLTARQKTLGELRSELAIRLGYPTQGGAAQETRALFDSLLQEAHEYLCAQLDDALLRKTAQITTSPGESLYDWHDAAEDEEIDADRVHAVGVRCAESYTPLIHGIREHQREQSTLRQTPSRYEMFNGQLLLWPTPDARYTVIVTYTAPLPRFVQEADRPGAPDRLVFMYALASAKAHYRHPDAAVAGKAFETLLAQHKSRQHGERRYFSGGAETESRTPYVIRTAQGYVAMRVGG
jgi:hypothetical protein